MRQFNITSPDETIKEIIQDKIDNLTKPKGSLGTLEDLALQIGYIQQTAEPRLSKPVHIVFAADHGIAAEKVSLSPQEITTQMVYNFLEGGAGINFLARQHNFDLKIVDAGVNSDFDLTDTRIIHRKIRKSTSNYKYEPAMTADEFDRAILEGVDIVTECYENGSNVISFGEMGITNTSSSAIWMNFFTGILLRDCIGAGSDHAGTIVGHKYNVLREAIDNYPGDCTTTDIMRHYGGFEMVMAVGAMLRAAELKMIILVDGFIMTSCMLAARRLYPDVVKYAIFGHQGDEAGHKNLLDFMNVKPILSLGLRLGEGTGALCAYPIIESAVRMINEMSSFKKVNVTKYF